MSERRIKRNRLRRQKERRKNILLFIMTVCLVISLSFSARSMLSNAQSQSRPVEYKYYASISVQEGDTLWAIAERYMGTHYECIEDYVKEICQINALENEQIRAGTYLIVPYYVTESTQ
ncbi:LysM peptidoglycan-binding domain-containing protein [Lachnospiraceae bacterium JLR.KK008]